MYNTARIIVRTTSKGVAQPIHDTPLDTCIGNYTANNHSTKQSCIKQLLKQNLRKLKLVPHPAKIDTNLPQTPNEGDL